SQLAATPILETDQYRYLWDGAVTAHGVNPYSFAPDQVITVPAETPQRLQNLADQGSDVLHRINHPALRSIYPPTAQAGFAVAYWIDPFRVAGLRWTWLGLDLAVVGMLFLLLRSLNTSTVPLMLGIYWLNPLLIKEVYNTGHMELVVLVAAMAALYAAIRSRTVLSMLLLGLATGAKLWPILWLPLLLRKTARSWGKWILGAAVFGVTVSLLAWPVLSGGLSRDSGFNAYAARWQMNDSIHLLLAEACRWFQPTYGPLAARILIALGMLAFTLAQLRRFRETDSERWLIIGALVVTAALFLVSPTQFPWYFLWILPLLALRPVWSLLALTMTLPLYYLRFPLAAQGHAAWFDYGLVWVEYIPIWLLLAIELRSTRPALRKLTSVESSISAPYPRVAVVIPALNEEQAIGSVLDAIPRWVTQIIVADNGSTDRTAIVAAQKGATVVAEPQRGYGAACLAGMKALDRPDIVVFLDGDFSDSPDEMERLIAPIVLDEADLVIGSRALGSAQAGSLTWPQRFGNALACTLLQLLYGVQYTDLGPFRAIRYSALRRLAMTDRNYGWTVQMQARAARLKLRAVEVPVSYRRRIGTSKISGTLRGVCGAGTKILTTIFREWFYARVQQQTGVTDHLIVFARFPEAGRAKTRLIPLLGPTGAALLHQQLVHITLETVRRLRTQRAVSAEVRYTGAPNRDMAARFGYDLTYRDQGDGDLGRRLRHAAAVAFEAGAQKVVLIGTDCPLLEADRLDQAFAALDTQDVVIGPALDGGYYLIGFKADHEELFTAIAWGGPEVLVQTMAACQCAKLTYKLLPVLSDVDHPEDLVPWAAARLAPPAAHPQVSVVIPARNEQDHLAATIASTLTAHAVEIIVVDGHSRDRTAEVARAFGLRVIDAEPSRGNQLNLGARAARGDRLLFLHADTILPTGYATTIRQTLSRDDVAAGAFDFVLDARGFAPRLIEWGVRVRSRIFGRPYGDQALYMPKVVFLQSGGFPNLPSMEDYAMLPRLKAHGLICVGRQKVSTSARRW
ncbi:MAG: TIGR04283 family arsenosugar biosynthesis glycosyltransferase, partial [Planctomycetota bacterium]